MYNVINMLFLNKPENVIKTGQVYKKKWATSKTWAQTLDPEKPGP